MEQDEKSVYGNIFMYTPGSRTLYGHFAILNGKPQIEEEEVTELMYPTEEELEAYRAEKRAATSFVPAQFPDSPDADSTGASTGSSATTIPAVVAQETGFKSADEITVTLAKNFFQKVQEKWDTPSNQAKFNEFIRIFSSPAEYKCVSTFIVNISLIHIMDETGTIVFRSTCRPLHKSCSQMTLISSLRCHIYHPTFESSEL